MIIDLFLNSTGQFLVTVRKSKRAAGKHVWDFFFIVWEIDGFFCPPQAENFVWIFFKLKSGDRENMKIIPPYLKGMGG